MTGPKLNTFTFVFVNEETGGEHRVVEDYADFTGRQAFLGALEQAFKDETFQKTTEYPQFQTKLAGAAKLFGVDTETIADTLDMPVSVVERQPRPGLQADGNTRYVELQWGNETPLVIITEPTTVPYLNHNAPKDYDSFQEIVGGA